MDIKPELQAAENLAHANAVGLRYVSDTEPGLRRYRKGKRFIYKTAEGNIVSDTEMLERIAKLAIPPAYSDVWICASPRGHLQATGRDARGRKQYRYHAKWRNVRDENKFGRLVEFAEKLPALRRRLRSDLVRPGLGRDKVIAVVVSIMAQTLIRIGNIEYMRSNKSYGLTTLHNRHVKFLNGGRAHFSFRGKSGLNHEVTLNDARLARLLRRCRQLPGQTLFQYLDDEGKRQPIDSGTVNDYLHEAMGESFTAKDFRTWGGTSLAVELFANKPVPEKSGEQTAIVTATVKEVAAQLRNTPAICRNSYIHPAVITAWSDGSLHRLIGERAKNADREKTALKFLHKYLCKKASRKPKASTAGV